MLSSLIYFLKAWTNNSAFEFQLFSVVLFSVWLDKELEDNQTREERMKNTPQVFQNHTLNPETERYVSTYRLIGSRSHTQHSIISKNLKEIKTLEFLKSYLKDSNAMHNFRKHVLLITTYFEKFP